jgi:hypothetical protein
MDYMGWAYANSQRISRQKTRQETPKHHIHGNSAYFEDVPGGYTEAEMKKTGTPYRLKILAVSRSVRRPEWRFSSAFCCLTFAKLTMARRIASSISANNSVLHSFSIKRSTLLRSGCWSGFREWL